MKVYILVALFGLAFARTRRTSDDILEDEHDFECTDFFSGVLDMLAATIVEPLPVEFDPFYTVFSCMPPPVLHFAIGVTQVLDASEEETRPELLCIGEFVGQKLLNIISERHANLTNTDTRTHTRTHTSDTLVLPSHCPMPRPVPTALPPTDPATCLASIPAITGTINVDLVKAKLSELLEPLKTPELCMIKMIHETTKLAHRIRHGDSHIAIDDPTHVHTILQRFLTAVALNIFPEVNQQIAASFSPDNVISAFGCFSSLLDEKINAFTGVECAFPPFGQRPVVQRKSLDVNKKTLKDTIKLYLGL